MLTLPKDYAYDSFWHLHHALFWGDDDLAYAHTAYFDDSGKKQAAMLVVGGYVSSVRRWEYDFNPAWRLMLARHQLQEFKRHSFGNPPAEDRVLADFAQIINDYTLHAFSCGIVMADWERANAIYPMTGMHLYPYAICARTCVKLVRDWCRENDYRRDEVEYLFDDGSEDADQFGKLLKMDRDPEVKAIVPVPAPSHRVLPIQSADYIAWEIHRQMANDPNAGMPSESVMRLLRMPEKGTITIHRFANLEETCIAAEIPTRATLQG
ncbi:MAG: DUF3800 domain-containing protein [Candidatus Binatus sp.]|uniref:DUF3800 domain-containing protein n=1 Tax=Candidatus Binatus sp. TaxID=2811406 RepID=UPI003C78D1EF